MAPKTPKAPGQVPEPLLRARLASIEGFDFSLALEVSLDRIDFLVHILQLFIQTHGGDADKMRELLASGDDEALRRLAHGLKGAAATISATRVAELAAEVQLGTRETGQAGSPEVAQLADELDALVAALEAALPPSPAA